LATPVEAPTNEDNRAEVRVTRVSKEFASTKALSDVTLTFGGGIHALVGANGAGKSTLLGIIAGRITPTGGEVRVAGHPLPYGRPRAVARLGVAAIYQELTVVPAMSAMENVFLGAPLGQRNPLTLPRATRRRYLELCDRMGAQIPPYAPAGSLSIANQQLLEIMRCIHREARVVLLDEPTSVLSQAERDRLFRIMREVRAEGRTLIFVSHDLEEVLDIADVIAVFRNGCMVEDKAASQWTKSTIIESMLGSAYGAYASKAKRETSRRAASTANEVVVEGLRVRPSAPEIGFSARGGEILGLAGLVGSGRSTVLRALAGDLKMATGRLILDGVSHRIPRSVVEARRIGVGLVPEDRKRMGLVMTMTASENVILPRYAGGRGQLALRALGRRAAESAGKVGFPTNSLARPVQTLSGGNQQKLLLARWALLDVRLLLADEPTRGVDVGAKLDILETLRSLADRGLTVVVASSELEDLEELCDRVIVMREGRPVGTLSREKGDLLVETMLVESFE
jgi:rhamnose transport system ATP-binding protein